MTKRCRENERLRAALAKAVTQLAAIRRCFLGGPPMDVAQAAGDAIDDIGEALAAASASDESHEGDV